VNNKISLAVLSFALSINANAASHGIFPGASQTVGNLANPHSIYVANSNPANASMAIAEEKDFRLNYAPSGWFTVELGKIDNFVDDLDELVDILDDPTSTTEPVDEILDRFNNVLGRMGEQGYLKTNVGISAPVLPFYINIAPIDAVLYTDFTYNVAIGLRVLDDELRYDQSSTFQTNTSAYVKSGLESRLGVGLSKKLYSLNYSMDLYGGAKLNLINMELSKQIIALQHMDGESIDDVVSDAYDDSLKTSTNISLDLGLRLVAEKYSLGLTITDINNPSFEYGAVGVNCDGYESASAAYANCETARYFIDEKHEIAEKEEHTRHAVAIIDGYYQMAEKWYAGFEWETAAYDDVLGIENQWLSLGAGYNSPNKIPSFRVGYRQNMAGSEVGTLNFGTTLFGVVTMDISWSPESVDVDGSSAPRAMGFSLGVQQRF